MLVRQPSAVMTGTGTCCSQPAAGLHFLCIDPRLAQFVARLLRLEREGRVTRQHSLDELPLHKVAEQRCCAAMVASGLHLLERSAALHNCINAVPPNCTVSAIPPNRKAKQSNLAT